MGRLPGDIRENDRKTYPLRKASTKPKEPEWALRIEEWGTRQEIDDVEYAHKKKKFHATRNIKKRTTNETPKATPTAARDHTSIGRSSEIHLGKPQRNTVRIASRRRHGQAAEGLPRFERKMPPKHAY